MFNNENFNKTKIDNNNLLQITENKSCVDCKNLPTTYINMIFGVFLCQNCGLKHKKLFNEFNNKIIEMSSYQLNDEETRFLSLSGNKKFVKYNEEYKINFDHDNIDKTYMTKANLYLAKYYKYLCDNKCYIGSKPTFEEGKELVPKPLFFDCLLDIYNKNKGGYDFLLNLNEKEVNNYNNYKKESNNSKYVNYMNKKEDNLQKCTL